MTAIELTDDEVHTTLEDHDHDVHLLALTVKRRKGRAHTCGLVGRERTPARSVHDRQPAVLWVLAIAASRLMR